MLGAKADDRWSSTDYLLADLKDWTQYVFLVGLAAASGKKPPEFQPAPRPTDAAAKRRMEIESAAQQERRAKILKAMKTGNWSEVGIDPTTHTYEVNE